MCCNWGPIVTSYSFFSDVVKTCSYWQKIPRFIGTKCLSYFKANFYALDTLPSCVSGLSPNVSERTIFRHHMICYKSIESLIETLRASWDCFLKRCFKIYAWRSDFKSVRIWWKRKLQKLNTPFTCQKHVLTLYVSHSFERFGYGVKTLNRCLAQHK